MKYKNLGELPDVNITPGDFVQLQETASPLHLNVDQSQVNLSMLGQFSTMTFDKLYGEGKFKKYWSEVSRGLKTNDAKRRDYHFMQAGSHLIYNFNTESQEAMSNLFVTGETILNKQFQNYGLFGNDRIYDRAELLGYISDNRPSAMDKSGTATRKIGSYIQRKTKDLIN